MRKLGLYENGRTINVDSPPDLWHLTTIIMIIDRYEYCGHTISYRRESISYKNKKTVKVPEDQWIVKKNTHDSIIDEETWNTAHRICENGRRRKVNFYEKGSLNGLLFCPDCGAKLYYKNHKTKNTTIKFFMCGYHCHYKLCSTHYVRREEVERAVLYGVCLSKIGE